jgi:predicted amidohydrolase YtcJ
MLAATAPELPQLLAAGPITTKDEMLLIRSVKAYGDGALGSRGAALLSAYNDDPRNKGLLVTAQDKLPSLFHQVISSGFALHFHAIGDRANRLALDQFAATFAAIGGQELRHRMEHAQVIAVDDIIRFKELGPQRLRGAYAWRTFLEQGSILAFGSDFPVELANPFFGIHAAVTRQDRNNQPVKGWIAEQALTLSETLRAFTIDASYAAAQDQSIGSLTKGYWADFILVDRDIFAIPAKDLWQATVNQTYIAGELVYERK